VQFVLIITHTSQLLIFECNYPKLMAVYILANVAYILYQFGAYYNRTYRTMKED